MTAGDAIALGFADHFVLSHKLDALREALTEGANPAEAIAEVAEAPPESGLLAARAWWDPIAEGTLNGAEVSAESALDATIRLLRVLEADERPETAQLLESVRGMCPTSVVVTLAQIARTRAQQLDLAAVLEDDLRVVVRIGQRPDFAEGVRAQVIDKDRSPKWQPSRIEDLDPAEVEAILAPHRPDETKLGLVQ
nr:enoyl-CoA hydratase/isomerase family protein [Leucobacter coleopterorum]